MGNDINCSLDCGIEKPSFRPGREQADGECEAYKVEISCLRKALPECGDDRICRIRILALISASVRHGNSYGKLCPSIDLL
jgi:hypothetical protein